MMSSGSSSEAVLEMDWSKRPGISDTLNKVDDYKEQQVLGFYSFVVIHGAGQQTILLLYYFDRN